jgi:hypothetical protein
MGHLNYNILFDVVRKDAETIDDRERASYWLNKIEWFSQQLTEHSRAEADLTEIVEACKSAFELHR